MSARNATYPRTCVLMSPISGTHFESSQPANGTSFTNPPDPTSFHCLKQTNTMPPTTTDGHAALMQPSSATKTPALDPQRFAILVQRSSKELKDKVADSSTSASASSRMSAYRGAVTKLRKSIDGALVHALSATRKLWRDHAELVVYCAMSLALLVGLSEMSVADLEARKETARMWKTLMETCGFVDWPRLEDKSLLPILSAAMTVIICALSCVMVPWSLFTRSSKGIEIFLWLIALVALTCLVGSGKAPASLREDSVEALASQTEAVANFNRGFCHAWCQKDEAGLAAFIRGDCGLKQKTVFDESVAKFDMKEWCLEAIAHQKYELVAEYSGVSPFAGLKGKAGRMLTTPADDFSVVNFYFTVVLAMLACFIAVFEHRSVGFF